MSRPVATLALAAGLLGGFGLELAHGGERACEAYGLVPAHASFGTALSSLFLHDPHNVLHIGGNLAFLVVFGVIVERALGSLRFLGLFAAAGLGGATVHVFIDPSSTTPLVGASGAICGLISFAVAVDRRFVGFAVAFSLVNIWYALGDSGGAISFGAHVGGLFIGTVAALFANFIVWKERFA